MADRTEPPPFVLRNNNAVVGWVFMPLWLGWLACFTYVFARQHPEAELILDGLWLLCLFSVGGAAWGFMQPRIAVSVAAGGVLVREIWLWRVRERRYAAADVFVPHVAASTDSDGDPYFKCLLWLPNGRVLTVAQGHQQWQIEVAHRHLLAALTA